MATLEVKNEQIRYYCNGRPISDPTGGILSQGAPVPRVKCGREVTALIEAIEFDGKPHIVECPHCENQITVVRG